MIALGEDSARDEDEIVGASLPAANTTRSPGTLIDELTARLAPAGLPVDVQNIVDVAVRAGMGERDPNWIWLLPILLRQVPAAAMRIEFEALSGMLVKAAPGLGTVPSREEENLESILGTIAAMRGELQKFPRRVGETLKPAVTEAVVDALETAPGRVKVEIDDTKLMLAVREAFANLYVLAAIGFGAFATVAGFIIGSKFG